MYKTYQFALVTRESLITSTPFGLDNDDLDCTAAEILSGYWDSLDDVTDAKELQAVVDKINEEHFQGDEENQIKIIQALRFQKHLD